MGKTFCWILLFCVEFNYACSQQVLFNTYTVQNGLVANPIRTVFQDKKGFIWIATWEGLSKYDGYRFTNFSTANGLSHNLVNDFFEKDDKLLVAENDGSIDVIQSDHVQKIFQAPSAVNRFVSTASGALLLTTDANGIYEFSEKKFFRPRQQLINYPIDRVIQLNDSLFIAHGGEETVQLFTSSYKTIATTAIGLTSLGGLLRDHKKRTWLCTAAGLKLLSLPPRKNVLLQFSALPFPFNIPLLSHGMVTDMLENADGSFWIGTYSGLIHLEASGTYQLYTEMNGLPSKKISTLFRDREDNIWIGTALGLAKYAGKSDIHSLNMDVGGIVRLENGDWLLSTSDGLQRQQKKDGRFTLLFPGFDPYNTVVQGSKPVKFYRGDAVGVLNENATEVIFSRKFPGLYALELASCTDGSGNSFIANDVGIAVITKTKWWIDKTLPYRTTSLSIDLHGYLWVGMWTNGLFRVTYKPSGDSLLLEAKNFSELIHTNQIRGLFCDKGGTIWVGTRYNGVYSLTPQANGSYRVKNFEKPQGLASNFITSFAETPAGDIWVGSYMGLDKIVREPNGYRVFNFSRATNFFAQVSSIVQADTASWYCVANNKLFRFRDIGLEHATPDSTYLLSVSIGDARLSKAATDSQNKVVLSHTKNNVKFVFGSLSFVNEGQIQYSYRLKGSADTSWSLPQNVHEVSYASLSPGNYSFEVRSLAFNGSPGKPAVFAFTIQPPFWRTVWFYILCVISIAAIFYGLYRYRVNQLLRLQKVRNRIATDLHDDIGSTLTNISVLSELSDKTLEQPAKARQYLQRITEEVNASGQALDDIIWSINTQNDTLDEMVARMRRFASELFDHTNTRYYFILEEDSGDKKLDMEHRRDVYLVYKETLSNIYKHASAKNVFIRLALANHLLEMDIRDDGRGFDPNHSTNRNGLKNMRARVDKWKGIITIESGEGKGTFIQIKIPVKQALPK
jgi:ligand-binding sensor domain-containing protein/two-component sensor histidine kinase